MTNQLQKKPESNIKTDNPVFCVYNVNSNFPHSVQSYPAIPLSCFEFHNPGKNFMKFKLENNNYPCGWMR